MSVTPDGSLIEWLKSDLRRRQHVPSDESLGWFVEETERAVNLYLRRENPLRPSAAARELARLARHLNAAANAAEKLGRSGFLTIAAVSGGSIDIEDEDVVGQILHLRRMAAQSERAAQVAADQSHSMQDGRGGPTPEQRLRQLIAYLLLAYEQHLGVRPMHTSEKDTGLAERGFTGFVKQALREFAPQGVFFEPRLIDAVVRELLPIRAAVKPPGPPDSRAKSG